MTIPCVFGGGTASRLGAKFAVGSGERFVNFDASNFAFSRIDPTCSFMVETSKSGCILSNSITDVLFEEVVVPTLVKRESSSPSFRFDDCEERTLWDGDRAGWVVGDTVATERVTRVERRGSEAA